MSVFTYTTPDGITWNYTLSGSNATIGNGTSTNGNGTTSGTGLSGAITIPDKVGVQQYTVTGLGLRAFFGCTGLTSVVIGNSVTSTANSVFNGCTNLKSVVLGNSVTTIGWYLFESCASLTAIYIPTSVTTIGANVFRYCTGLTAINIPTSVTSIGGDCFTNTSLLLTVTMKTQTISSVLFTSPTVAGSDISFFGNASVTLVEPPPPTALSFVNNTLTIQNSINSNNVVRVSFQLPAGSIMYSFNVTSLLNTNSINYSLDISGGANVLSGSTITSTGVNLLGGNNLTPAVDTTYILTMISGSTNTYTIIGKMLGPGYTTIPYAPPIIHHDFNPAGTNKGSLGSIYNITSNPTIITDPIHVQKGMGAHYSGETGMLPSCIMDNGGIFTTSANGFFVSLWFKHNYDMTTTRYYSKKTKQQLLDAGYIPEALLTSTTNTAYVRGIINSLFFSLSNIPSVDPTGSILFGYNDVNPGNNNKSNPLIWSSYNGNPNGVYSTQSANIGISDNATTTPATIGVFNGETDFHHLVIDYGSTDDTVKVYVDNVLMTSYLNTSYQFRNFTHGKITLQNGMLDTYLNDFRIYNYAATTDFISYLYKLGSNTNIASLSNVSIDNLIAAGASLSQLVNIGKPINDIINAGYTIDALIKGGVSITTLITSGVSIDILLANNVTISQLLAGGVPFSQLVNYAQWLDLSATSNIFNRTYVNNFIDLSGDMIIRNNGALIVDGDVSMGGNLIMTIPGPTITPYFISNAFLQSAGAPVFSYNGTNYYYVGSTPVPLTTISVDSLDKISISTSKMTGGAITGGITNATYACRYTTDHTGATVYNNWIVGEFAANLTKLCRVAFTLNGTTPSIAYIRQAYANGNYTISDVSMALPFNVASINGTGSVNHVSSTGLTYLLTDISLNVTTPAPMPKPTFAGDTTLKSRLFIGNDISVNGNLYVGGDLSVNGTFSGNFANNVIPPSAIINYPSSDSNVEITGNVRIAGDASFNGTRVDLSTNTILQVSGNITFTDGTTLSTYVDDISSGSFAQGNVIFKAATFAAVTCPGNIYAGDSAALSDYRIKTNVTDLDESYSVDKLEPIQYDNNLSNKHEFGLIAHELQALYPELVKGEKDGAEYQRVNYNGLIGILVKEVQDLNRRKEDLCKK